METTDDEKSSARAPNRVREIRSNRGLTLKSLATLSGLYFTQIAKIETGERPAKDFELRALGRALNVFPADLLNTADGGLSVTERELIERYGEAPDNLQRAIDAILASNEANQHAS